MRIKQSIRYPSRRSSSSSKLTAALLLLSLFCATLSLGRAEAQTTIQGASTLKAESAFQSPEVVRRYQQMITPESLAGRLYFLASDIFEGRETATRGQKLAADYLASQYRSLGLAPKGTVKDNDPLSLRNYFQPFKVYKREAKRTGLQISINGERVVTSEFSQEAQDDLAYFAFGKAAGARGGVVFAGYGIEDGALGYKDFSALREKRLSVDGKWVMILADEPLRDASTSLLPTAGGKPSKWSATRAFDKRHAIWAAGRPAGVLIIGDAGPRSPEGGFTEQSRRVASSLRGVGGISLQPPSSIAFPPTYVISTKLADRILSASGRTVRDLAREINGSLKPVVFDVKGAEVNSNVEAFEPLETENVLAFIEGSDPKLKDEVVIVSSHYDHLGRDPQLKGDQIYNGAADDASGTIAAVALAEIFMQARADGRGPRRSILFLNTSGEEKGILGSAYYTDMQPVVPLDRVVANVNMDGIAGEDAAHAKTNPNYLYVIGDKDGSPELVEMSKRLNQLTGTNLLLDDSRNFPSDQRNFEKLLVPYIYYSTGLTEHYHKPSDEPQTINYEHMALAVRLSFATVWQIANADAPPSRRSRDGLVMTGYACPPCSLECDQLLFKEAGACPVCDMNLYPKYEARK